MWCVSSSFVRWYKLSYLLMTSATDRTASLVPLVRYKYRRRLRLPPEPHEAVQSFQSPQSFHAHSMLSWHWRGHAATSSALTPPQFLPPCCAYRTIVRKRFISPLHLPHAPQSCQSPYMQSTGCGPVQLRSAQCTISESPPRQPAPPCAGGCTTSRLRMRWPTPHEALQPLHPAHGLSRQSTGELPVHPSGALPPSPGRHGQISFSGPRHQAPLPRPYLSTPRERLMIPLQLAEQWVHWPQALRTQSTDSSQASRLQKAVSLSSPSGSFPQTFAILRIFRVLKVLPPPQEAEHGAQGCQGPQLPSRHTWTEQSCVLHGVISSLTSTAQALPPFVGTSSMKRLRNLWPPPHELVQPLQPSHWLHRQSETLHGLSGQPRTCLRLPRQPSPA
mmetsp:Transcript_41704/g.118968  ORF Transcript_41704/g.118968 Transcript_41704/m.118968 type:complete len:389 (+) Transcript_41704:259-1425(+)